MTAAKIQDLKNKIDKNKIIESNLQKKLSSVQENLSRIQEKIKEQEDLLAFYESREQD